MTKEVPRSTDIMAAFRAKSLEKGKGRGSLEMVAASNPFVTRAANHSTAAGVSRKRRRQATNVATTTRSLGDTPTRPQLPSPICLEYSSLVSDADSTIAMVAPAPQAPVAPLSLLAGDL